MKTTTHRNVTKKIDPLVGLQALESIVDRDTLIYILRCLYRIVFTANHRRENKGQLQKRIQHFEKQSQLPAFLSALPMSTLLSELEDAQFFYPIRHREVTLPSFH